MRIGMLRKRLHVQRKKLTLEGGDVLPVWESVATVWGDVKPCSASSVLSGTYGHRTSHVVRIRVVKNIKLTNGMRLVGGERTFSVRHIVNVEDRDRWLDVYVEENGYLG